MLRFKRPSLTATLVAALLSGSCALAAATDCTDAMRNGVNSVYDAAGRMVATTDANGGRFNYAYDAAGRLIMCTDAKGFTTRFQYDRNGNRLPVQDTPASTMPKS